jgi:hypothetical protein
MTHMAGFEQGLYYLRGRLFGGLLTVELGKAELQDAAQLRLIQILAWQPLVRNRQRDGLFHSTPRMFSRSRPVNYDYTLFSGRRIKRGIGVSFATGDKCNAPRGALEDHGAPRGDFSLRQLIYTW